MSTIGGMNSNSILPYIDYESFKNNTKPIIGYSDVTAILLGIYSKIGVNTFCGPAFVASFGELEPFVSLTFNYFEDMLIKRLKTPYKLKKTKIWTDEMIDWESQKKNIKIN